ncbi:MAG TPA: OmpA family protein [Pseudomonadales bacterium]|nr:OmpA family protein [Pseudomonadales bacterium]
MKKLNRLSIAVAASLAAISTAQAGQWTISGNVQDYWFSDGVFGDAPLNLDEVVAPGLSLGYQFSPEWAVEVSTFRAETQAKEDSSIKSTWNNTHLDGVYTLQGYGVKPYARLGVGRGRLDLRDDGAEPSYDTTVNMGVGVKFPMDESLSLTSEIFGVNNLDREYTDAGLALGVNYVFGAKKPAPKAEPAPAPAPVVAAPVDGDDDQDGVLNSKDQCPNTPAGAAVDEKGCNIILKEKVSVNLDIKFDTGKAVIKPAYEGQVQKVADFLRKYPDTKATIEGHTDNKGTAKLNKKLSQERADAVKNDLINNFHVDPARLTAVGYGFDKPVADNKTEAGRAANRRTVAVISATEEKMKTR